MMDLVAQGPTPQQRWRRTLQEGESHIIGRGALGFDVQWDPAVSRKHVEIELVGNRLRVGRLPDSTNPVFFHGKQLTEFWVSTGEHFVIGQTRFTLVEDRVHVTMDRPIPDAEQTFQADFLRQIDYRDAGQKIAVLNQLPDVISRSVNDTELIAKLINILMTGVRRANTIALVKIVPDGNSELPPVEVLHWDQRVISEGPFEPSWKLIHRAIENKESVLHFWKYSEQLDDDGPVDEERTLVREGDWAFVTPLRGELSQGWAIYVSGKLDAINELNAPFDPQDLRDDIKFTELIATTLASFRQAKLLERRQAGLRSFFSPVVLDVIAGQDPQAVLAPRQCDVSVLFCDVRGFSLKSERYARDLHDLLDRVSQALGVTTNEILVERGVVGDFHGDSTMGFWGWPLDQPDRALRACRAALKIHHQFESFAQRSDHPLHDFQIGIGIASGTAVAGKIGTQDQVKVSVFGPVVNVASRLEMMTRRFGAEILIDETTAESIRDSTATDALRVRKLAVVRPFGMSSTITLNQLLPPLSECNQLTDDAIAAYEKALDAFVDGNWELSYDLLQGVPAEDHATEFLTAHITRHELRPPPNWNGVILLDQK